MSGGPPGGAVHYYNAEYWDIVQNERIVSSYEMHIDKQRISVSLATMEFKPNGVGHEIRLHRARRLPRRLRRCRRARTRHAASCSTNSKPI